MVIDKKHIITEKITLYPHSSELDFVLMEGMFPCFTVAEVKVDPNVLEEVFGDLNSTYKMSSKALEELQIFLSCFQISNDIEYDKIDISGIDIHHEWLNIFPLPIISNIEPINVNGQSFESMDAKVNKVFDDIAKVAYYQFGPPMFEEITNEHIINSKEFHQKVLRIFHMYDLDKESRKTSIIMKNILLQYYQAKIGTDSLYSISTLIGILESLFGTKSSPTMSLQERVAKLMKDMSNMTQKFIRDMYDFRSNVVHIKTELEFTRYPSDKLVQKRFQVATLTSVLIRKWVEEINTGKTAKSLRNSIIPDSKYIKKNSTAKNDGSKSQKNLEC